MKKLPEIMIRKYRERWIWYAAMRKIVGTVINTSYIVFGIRWQECIGADYSAYFVN